MQGSGGSDEGGQGLNDICGDEEAELSRVDVVIVYASEGGSKSCTRGDDKGKDSDETRFRWVKDSVTPDGVNRDCCVV